MAHGPALNRNQKWLAFDSYYYGTSFLTMANHPRYEFKSSTGKVTRKESTRESSSNIRSQINFYLNALPAVTRVKWKLNKTWEDRIGEAIGKYFSC